MNYRAVFHLDMNDVGILNLALTNVTNLLNAIPGQTHHLVMLFNGPAVQMLTSQNAAAYMEKILPLQGAGVSFMVCNNALRHFTVDPADLIPGCEIVPAGVVSLIELQQEGYAYIKP